MAEEPEVEGRDAYRRKAWEDAFRLLSVADRGGPLGAEDLDRLATAAQLTGRVETAGAVWARAHHAWCDSGEIDRAVRSAFWLAMTLLLRGEHARGGGWLARAERLLPDAPAGSPAPGYLSIPRALQWLTDDPAAAYQEFEQAAELGVRAGDLDLIVLARLGSGQALIAQGDGRSGAVLLDEAMLAVTYDPVSPLAAGIVYCAVIIACRQIFDLRRAQEWTAALSQWCDDQQGLVPYRGQCLVHRSEILQIRGDWAAAWNEIEQACRHLADPPGDPVQGMALYQRGELLRLRGDVTGAEEAYRTAARWGHPMQPGLALLRLAQGRVDDASAAMRRTTADQQRPAERVSCLAAYAEIELAAHHPEAARTAVAELQRLAEHFGSTYLYALAERAAGGLLLTEGDPEAGSVRLRAAILAWRQLIAPYEVARTSVLLGDACALLGDHDTARIHRQAARETFEQLGALPDLHRLDGRLRAQTGELTERECEVLRMVATGRTNREVAAELVISEHTVRRHLQNIFGKLGIGSRSAATAYAHRHHLV